MQQQNPYLANRPQDVYRKQAILTASPSELIVMLYDGCRKQLVFAKRAIEKNNMSEAHNCLMKAQDIVGYLVSCLDMKYELSEQLLDIYEFVLVQLGEINIAKDAARIDPIVDIIGDLRGAWEDISHQQEKGRLELAEE